MKHQAVIFDLFGTLVPTILRAEFERHLTNMASILRAPRDEYVRLWMKTEKLRMSGHFLDSEAAFRYVLGEIGVVSDLNLLTRAAAEYEAFTRKILQPRADAESVLTKLRLTRRKIGLISDCTPEVPLIWPTTSFNALIDVAIFSCQVKFNKPDNRIYKLACDGLQVNPEDCLYVGDGGSSELTGAATAGMHPVLIRVPLEQDDAYRPGEENWSGQRISSLREVLTLAH